MDLPDIALWHAFNDGHRFVTTGETVTTRVENAAELVLPTGRIVVSDPVLNPFNEPFSVAVEPGAYPVLLSYIKDEIGLVMVYFADGPPIRWEVSNPSDFHVDSGRGCLMDQKICRFLRRKAENDQYERYLERFGNFLEESEDQWENYCLSTESGANMILFRTHGGDGVFPAFFGFNSDDEVVCLIIDMFLCFEHVLGSAPE